MENEALIRLSAFVGLFALFALMEAVWPRRETTRKRWGTNWALVLVDTFALRLMAILVPFLAIAAAVDAGRQGWGLFNAIDWPLWLEAVLAIVILDFVVWGHHVLNHKVDLFWRFHRVHHADEEMDVTTAIRFHPLESVISMIVKVGTVYLLGPTALAVLLFEVILNGSAMFNHSNTKLPLWLDRRLRWFMITPDMHRIHHSADRTEHDSNYGFALSIWDRLFGTYTVNPNGGHDGMTVGLRWRNGESRRLGWSLVLPFKKL
ncbi:sterol desaturase family protein [Shimia ponticola]|uniref:sterol desaturase family protein n=1 Tax=Shimia ponticola TaxID=2582893 RepID=UPI0011BDAF11|nr:sterol desaturase family protein [Shimia ponticola]